MKKIFILTLIIISVSCGNENDISKIENTISTEFSLEKFVGSKVGYIEKAEIELVITNDDLIKSFNNYSKKIKLGKKAISSEMLEVGGKNYIRFYNEDESVSTVALINTLKNKNDFQSTYKLIEIGTTVCTTEECANCCGCIPNGDYCTRCQINLLDCKRTTSN